MYSLYDTHWLDLARHNLGGSINERKFRANFGLPSAVLPSLWKIVSPSFNLEDLKQVHLLWCLNWLKEYPTYDAAATKWKKHVSTVTEKIKLVLDVLHFCLDEVCKQNIYFRTIILTYYFRWYAKPQFEVFCNFLTTHTLRPRQIDWESRFDDHIPTKGLFKHCTFIVDVTECRMARPNDKDIESLLWSGKAKMPSLKFEGIYLIWNTATISRCLQSLTFL